MYKIRGCFLTASFILLNFISFIMINEIKNKTAQLVEIVAHENFGQQMGLLSGTTGSLFLLSYYSEYSKDLKYLDLVEERILNTFELINNNASFSNLTYSNGIAGFLWALQNLNNNGYIDIDLTDFASDATPLLTDFMMNKIEEGDYDFLHGALGVANYFVDESNPASIKVVNQFNQKLISKGVINKEADIIYYLSNVNIKENEWREVINLSLSHGMASIIYYLQRCLKNKNFANDELAKTLRQLISFYRKNQNDISIYNCYYPSWIDKEDPNFNSRMAWCYGDLGIGLVFLIAAEVLNDVELKEHSIRVLKYTLRRTDLVKEAVKEAGICHGSAGLVKMYKTIYRITGRIEFNVAAEYWLKVTLDFANHTDGHAGYKTYFHKTGFQNNCGLLEGVGGIGLVFLEELMGKPLSWEKALMLS